MILEKLATESKLRVLEAKKNISLEEIKEKAFKLAKGEFKFKKALEKQGINFICEIKKASPSKGIIDEEFNYMKIAEEYELAKADAISVLTEPKYFLGSDNIFKEIRKKVTTPMIRKDFTVDEYQIYEAKIMGADAILLICSILDKNELNKFLKIAHELGLDALVETHNKDEIKMALDCGANIIGVNNRNLKNFNVDFNNSINLRNEVPKDIIFVAESGISSEEDIKILSQIGVNAVLIGEMFMRSKNKKELIEKLKAI